MNVLITGGNGYIGSRLIERFLQERHKPTVIDHKAIKATKMIQSNLRVFQMDAEDAKCERLFADTSYDVVIHLACEALPVHHEDVYSRVLHANLAALGNILYLSNKFAIPKVIVLFDYRIYGQQQDIVKREDTECRPDSDIGYQEDMRERYCDAYRRQGLRVVSLRTGMIYGSTQTANPDEATLRQLLVPYDDDENQSLPRVDEQLIDCLFINDLVEAIFRVCENQTSPILNIGSGRGTSLAEFRETSRKIWHEYELGAVGLSAVEPPDEGKVRTTAQDSPVAAGYYLDYSRAAFELEWLPKYSLEDGIHKTVQSFIRRDDRVYSIKHSGLRSKAGTGIFSFLANPDIENLMIFIVSTLAAYLLKYRLGINLDLMILYIILINIFFGLRTGGVAIALAMLVRLWFCFGIDNMRLIDFFNDVNQIMYLAFYFIIGASIGVVIDSSRQEKSILKEDLEQIRSEQKYTTELYQSSLEVKKSLQAIIANTEDSFSKVQYIFSRLDQIEPELIFETVVWTVADILKTPQVLIYTVDPSGKYLRLAASTVPVVYPKSIMTESSEFWQMVVHKQKIKINKDLLPECPMVGAPIIVNQKPIACVLLDGLDFLQLNQYYLNTLKSMCQLIAYYISKERTVDQAAASEKYFAKTCIMKKEWFNKIITAKKAARNPEPLQTVLIKFVNEVNRYQSFYKRISPLIRSVDYIGELGKGKMGVLMSNIELRDVPGVQNRLAEKGFRIEWMDVR